MRPSNNLQNKILYIENFSKYVWKFSLAVLQNNHWNTIITRYLWEIKVGYDLLDQPGSYIIQFQITYDTGMQVRIELL